MHAVCIAQDMLTASQPGRTGTAWLHRPLQLGKTQDASLRELLLQKTSLLRVGLFGNDSAHVMTLRS